MSPDKLEITADTDDVDVEVDIEQPEISIAVDLAPDAVVEVPSSEEFNVTVEAKEVDIDVLRDQSIVEIKVDPTTEVIVLPQGYRGPPGPEGDPGPMGPPGQTGPPGEKSTTVFTQLSPSAVWYVNHNLNCYPAVTVIDSGGNELIPDLIYLDANNLRLSFAAPTSGKVYLN